MVQSTSSTAAFADSTAEIHARARACQVDSPRNIACNTPLLIGTLLQRFPVIPVVLLHRLQYTTRYAAATLSRHTWHQYVCTYMGYDPPKGSYPHIFALFMLTSTGMFTSLADTVPWHLSFIRDQKPRILYFITAKAIAVHLQAYHQRRSRILTCWCRTRTTWCYFKNTCLLDSC